MQRMVHAAEANAVHTVKWIEPSGTIAGRLPLDQALLVVKAGNFIGKCTATRVHYIKEIETRAPNYPDESFWEGRACGLYRWATPLTAKGMDYWFSD